MPKTLVLLVLIATVGCASAPSPAETSLAVDKAFEAADLHLADGREAEAAYMLDHAETLAPADPRVEEYAERLSPASLAMWSEGRWMGANRARRAPTERSGLARAALYLPDRLLDLADVFSFDMHIGTGVFANVHFTRALQFGAGGRTTMGLGWHDGRSLGLQSQDEAGVVALGFGAQAYDGWMAGTSGIRSGGEGRLGLQGPGSELHQEYRDYWAVGASFTFLFFGFDFDLHPIELADFAAGWTTYDFLNDDFAGTRGLELTARDEDTLTVLVQARAEGVEPEWERPALMVADAEQDADEEPVTGQQ